MPGTDTPKLFPGVLKNNLIKFVVISCNLYLTGGHYISDGSKQFLVPVYQRYYSWGNEQCERLWDDIVKMQKDGKPGHFVGSIVNIAEQAMPTGVQKYMIIDGQQRMTTLTLLLIALRDYALDNPEDATINAKRIDNKLLSNNDEDGDDRHKLILTETDRDTLIALVQKKPQKPNASARIIANYEFFVGKIKDQELTPAEVYESIGKLQIVNITLDRSVDDAQAIFESLNSTGKELSQSDLIRNYVLMGLEAGEQTYIYEHLWRPMELLFEYDKQDSAMDSFFRDYLTMKIARIPKIGQVYDEFKAYHNNCEFSTIRDFCQDIYNYAVFYTNMIFAKGDDTRLVALYEDINTLRMDVVYPFLLKVHSDQDAGTITLDELIEIIEMCISYVYRRNVCNIPTNSLNKTFATLKNEIRPADYLNSIKAFFILRDDYKVFPNDDKFTADFVVRDIYNMRARNYTLSHLENYQNKGPIVIENYTIEHIMPQNSNPCDEWKAALGTDWKEVQKTYLHTIGNLTLTAYNSEMSDRPFMEKMDMEGGFKESALRLNAYVVKMTTWNADTIKERAKLLAQKAVEIWKYPKLSAAELAPYEIETKPAEKYSLETYELNMMTKTLFEMLDRRIMNLSPDVKREFKKLYIAYKLDTNFVDIVIQKNRLRISLNMKFDQVVDPLGLCKDITGLGRWGNGDVELFFEHTADIDSVMSMIEQSYNLQAE